MLMPEQGTSSSTKAKNTVTGTPTRVIRGGAQKLGTLTAVFYSSRCQVRERREGKASKILERCCF